MYDRPLNEDEIRKRYPDKAEWLLNDPVHAWRAKTGIELIHEEPTQEELERIWKNWQEMDDALKVKSDQKSKELFGMSNEEHYRKLEAGHRNQ